MKNHLQLGYRNFNVIWNIVSSLPAIIRPGLGVFVLRLSLKPCGSFNILSFLQ